MADVRASSAFITLELQRYGLGSLTDWALNAIVNDWSEDQVIAELYNRAEFKSRFAGMFALEAAGKPTVSVDEYIAYEKTVHALAAQWGMSLSKDEVDTLIANEVSNVEVQARFDLTAEAMFESDDETISELVRMSNVQAGDLMRYFMDPKEELGVLQSRFRQAQIAGASLRTGWGQLTQLQAERLQQTGMTREQAQTGFGELARMGEIVNPFSNTEDIITADEQIAFLAGDMDAAMKLETRQRTRLAEFGGSSSFAQGKEGFAVGGATQ
jgi:hypothetical protein